MPRVVFARDILLGLCFVQQKCIDFKVTAALIPVTCKEKKKKGHSTSQISKPTFHPFATPKYLAKAKAKNLQLWRIL